MNYADVFTGISAASVAWKDIPGWNPVFYSQYDPAHNYKSGPDFPSRVLAHHYPHVPNLGDITKIETNETFISSSPELISGGSPCQGFSLSGLRGGLADERSNLALAFCRVLLAKQPRWFIWENVPGVHSSFSNDQESKEDMYEGQGETILQRSDFARMLEAFHECGYSVSWRIFDSQYFGVPQRRRRVFVVGHIGTDWRPPFAVLFERESMRRDFTPGREKREKSAGETAGCIDASYGRLQGASGQDLNHNHSTLVTAYGGNNTSGPIEVATALKSNNNDQDFESETFIVSEGPEAFDVRNMSMNGEISATLQSKKSGYSLNYINPVVFPMAQITSKVNQSNPQPDDPAPTLNTGGHANLLITNIPFKSTGAGYYQEGIGALRARDKKEQENIVVTESTLWSIMPQNSCKDFKAREVHVTQPLMKGSGSYGNQGGDIIQTTIIESKQVQPLILNDQGGSIIHVESGNVSPTLRKESRNHEPIVVVENKKGKNSAFDSLSTEKDVHPALKKENNQNNIVQEIPVVIDKAAYNAGVNADFVPVIKETNTAPTIKTSNHQDSVFYSQIIRRLTPKECERLQGFEDEYTLIPLKRVTDNRYKKAKDKSRYREINGHWWLMSADGPRYEALGNSMTTNVMKWIGERIDKVDKMMAKLNNDGKS